MASESAPDATARPGTAAACGADGSEGIAKGAVREGVADTAGLGVAIGVEGTIEIGHHPSITSARRPGFPGASLRSRRNSARPRLILLFTVPTEVPTMAAISP
jgi:hypothetical protein